jgi:hypothetical protein
VVHVRIRTLWFVAIAEGWIAATDAKLAFASITIDLWIVKSVTCAIADPANT